jgi:hypothetical protein
MFPRLFIVAWDFFLGGSKSATYFKKYLRILLKFYQRRKKLIWLGCPEFISKVVCTI